MPTEVIATPRADQQIADLDRTPAEAFHDFLDDLAAQGGLPDTRLPTERPDAGGSYLRQASARLFRVVVAFGEPGQAWTLLSGRHDDQDPALDVRAELYRLLGVEPPVNAGRDKPPCCDQITDLPPVLGDAVAEFVERAARVRRTRRQPKS